MHAEHQHGQPGLFRPHRVEQLETALVRQADIDQRHVELAFPNQAHGILRRFGFARDLHPVVGLQHAPHAIADDAVVVHQQDPDFAVSHL
ncbi:hypothetical protein D3C81_1981850 [compost metagenome]